MDDYTQAEAMIRRYKNSIKERDTWVESWQDCYDYALPGRTGFYDFVSGQSNVDKIYDSTASIATQEFASRIQAGLTPTFTKWFDFRAGQDIPEENRAEVEEALEEDADTVWEFLSNSNMNQELHESYMDLAVGTGGLLLEEGNFAEPLKFTSVPQTQLSLSPGPFGQPDRKYRIRKLTVDDIKVIWPTASIPQEMENQSPEEHEERTWEVIECVSRDWMFKETERYQFTVFTCDPEHILFQGHFAGMGSSPLITFRWSKASGEVYGRGPLFNVMPDVKTLNMVVELVLENAHMAIAGMWQTDDDGTINPDTIELVPGTVLPRNPGSTGMEPLSTPGNFSVSDLIVKDMRHNIKKSLFNDSLGAPEGTPMSATEVHERMADLSRTIGSAYGRMHTELITPLLQRAVFILRKQGRLILPKLNGKEVKIVNVSPLAQAQHNENVARVARWLELLNAGFGPQMVNLVVKAEEAAAYTGSEIGVPQKLIRGPLERQQLTQAIAATEMLQAGADPMGGGEPAGQPPMQGAIN
jgi:hypothetical protein|tara:strand:+ start:2680 stop:4260 length:1581 start_codon:yes stop_codon:yes gene_type:complete